MRVGAGERAARGAGSRGRGRDALPRSDAAGRARAVRVARRAAGSVPQPPDPGLLGPDPRRPRGDARRDRRRARRGRDRLRALLGRMRSDGRRRRAAGSSATEPTRTMRSSASPRRAGSAARRRSSNGSSCSTGAAGSESRPLERVSEGRASRTDTPDEDARRSPAPSGARVDGTRDESCCRPLRATRNTRRDSLPVSTCSASVSTRWPRPSRRPRRRWRRRTARSRACDASSSSRDEQIQALAARPQAPAGGDSRELHAAQGDGRCSLVRALDAGRVQADRRAHGEGRAPRSAARHALDDRVDDGRWACGSRRRARNDQETTRDVGRNAGRARRRRPTRSIKRQLDDLASTAIGAKLRLDGQAAELESLKSQLAERQSAARRTSCGRC